MMVPEGEFVANVLARVARGKAPPILPELSNPVLPETDADFEAEGEVDDTVLVTLGVAVGIEYVDGASAFSRRTITVRKVRLGLESHMVVAWCHTRRAVRTFRIDRIKALIDPRTGEMEADPEDVGGAFALLLNQRLGDPLDAARAVIEACAPGVNILNFLSRCDGHEHPDELQRILSYIDSVALDLNVAIDADRLPNLLRRMHVSEDLFYLSLKRVRFSPPDAALRLLRYARQVIDADEIISAEEAKFGLELEILKRS
jgi:hypothetical protein